MNRRRTYRAPAIRVHGLSAVLRLAEPNAGGLARTSAHDIDLFDVSFEGVGFSVTTAVLRGRGVEPASIFRRDKKLECEVRYFNESAVFFARVAWANCITRKWRCGLHFHTMTPYQTDFLRRLVMSLQQRELRFPMR